MRPEQTVAEMAEEVLSRQAKAMVAHTRSQSGKSVANGHAARQRIWLWHSAEDSAELLSLLYNAQTKEQIDVVAAANRRLASHPHDEAVRLARKQAKRRRLGSPL